MDHTVSDSSGIRLQTCLDDGFGYTASFLEFFIPAYQSVNQSPSMSSVSDRYQAIQFAANASLAITASGATWSDALCKKLALDSTEVEQNGDMLCDDRELRSTEVGMSTDECTSDQEKFAECSGNNLSTQESCARASCTPSRRDDDSPAMRRRVVGRNSPAFRMLRKGYRENCYRNQVCPCDLDRMAVLRKLALRNKNRRRLMRSSWKPRATLRKATSLAKLRRRPSRSPKVVDSIVERDQDFQSGIVALQRLVPGGTGMDTAVLLDETADFVMFLQMQVRAMQAIANAADRQSLGLAIPAS